MGGEVNAEVTPEYEEISLHEAKDIYLTDNAAYRLHDTSLVFCCLLLCFLHVVL